MYPLLNISWRNVTSSFIYLMILWADQSKEGHAGCTDYNPVGVHYRAVCPVIMGSS